MALAGLAPVAGPIRSRFRTPSWTHSSEIDHKPILVREFIPGVPLDWFSKGQSDFPAWEIIGALAAEIHVHEVLIVLNWLRESLRGENPHPPKSERQRLAGLLRRVGG
jgi:hypothetical protein